MAGPPMSLSVSELESLVGPEVDPFGSLFGGVGLSRSTGAERRTPAAPASTPPAAVSSQLPLPSEIRLAPERATPAGSATATPAAGRRSRRGASSVASASSAAAQQSHSAPMPLESGTGRVSTPTHGEELTARSSPSRPMSAVESTYSELPPAAEEPHPLRESAAASVGQSLAGEDSFLPWEDEHRREDVLMLEHTMLPTPMTILKPSVEDEARRLEGELAELTLEVDEQLARNTALQEELQAAEGGMKARIDDRNIALRKEQASLEPRLAESREYQRSREEEIRLSTSVQLAALRSSFTDTERRRYKAFADDLRAERREVLAEIDQVLSMRELLKRGLSPAKAASYAKRIHKAAPQGPEQLSEEEIEAAVTDMVLSREGVFLTVEDQLDVQSKLMVGQSLINSFIIKARDATTAKITEIIRREVNNAVSNVWKDRVSARLSANAMRTEKLLAMQHESIVALGAARDQCAKLRQASVDAWHERVAATEAKLKATASANLERQIAEFNVFRDRLLQSARAQTADEMAQLDERQSAVGKADDQACNMSCRDAIGRCEMQRKLHHKLWTDEKNSLTRNLAKETEIKAHHAGLTEQHLSSAQKEIDESATVLHRKIAGIRESLAARSRACAALSSSRDILSGNSQSIAEKSSVVANFGAVVNDKAKSVEAERERLLMELSQIEVFLGRIGSEAHDDMLQLRSEVAKIERTKVLWEKEFRMALTRTVEPQSASNQHFDPVVQSRVLFVGEDAMISIAQSIRNKLADFSRQVGSQHKTIQEWALRLRDSDEELAKNVRTADSLLERLFSTALKLPDTLHEVHKKEMRLMSESTKLDSEKDTMENDKNSFEHRAAQLRTAAALLREDSAEACAAHDAKRAELLAMQRSQRELEAAQHDVLRRHCEMQHTRDELSREQNQVHSMQTLWLDANARAQRVAHAFGADLSAAKQAMKGSLEEAAVQGTATTSSGSTKREGDGGYRQRSALGEVSSSQYNADVSCH